LSDSSVVDFLDASIGSTNVSLGDVAHGMVEYCYRMAQRLARAGNYSQADDWRMLAAQLTAAESFAKRTGL
jgi:hypothetical protein